MAAISEVLKAKTKPELRKKFAEMTRKAREKGYEPQWEYEESRVRKTKDGYEIHFRAHV